jgi:hypothetical protein
MNSTHRVVIYGQSIFLMAIEVGLANQPELEVIRLHGCPSEAIESIIALNPHLVVVEQGNSDNELILTLLRLGLALVELNEKGQGTILTRRNVPVSGPADLVRLIEST